MVGAFKHTGIKDSRFTKKLAYDMHPVVDFSNVVRMKIDNKFGVIADTHLGSTTDTPTKLRKMYRIFKKEKIKQVFHAGDIVDGENVYRGHGRNLKIHGYEGQASYAVENYPKVNGIKTYVIAGNHDMSFYKNSGADIVKYISDHRKDIEYCGIYYVRFLDRGFKMDMVHPDGSPTYAKSYPIQKWIRNNESPSMNPHIMIFGHYHTHGWFGDHEIECIMAGCFQRINAYLIRRGYGGYGNIGGFIMEIERRGPNLISFSPKWITP